MEKRKKYKWPARILKFLIGLFAFTLVQAASLKFINPPVTPNVAWERVEAFVKGKPEKQPVYRWKNIEQISPHLRRAVIASEDQRFLSHRGFDFNEIQKAYNSLIREKKLRGASTISMQTARSVFLLSGRHVFRKLAEIYYTALIELFWSKHRILEMYLNTVDWGTGVTGAEAAAQKYFSKSAKDLSREEAALMASILPNPHKWSVKNPSAYIRMRQSRIMKAMHMMPLI